MREIKKSDDAREAIKSGIDQIADVVKVTLGAKGRNVALDTMPYQNPVITNDGVTIARELLLTDKFENIGAKLVREVANKTNDVAGDGTTTATLLMQSITTEGLKALNTGADPIAVRRGIEKTAKMVIELVKKEAVKAEDINTLVSTATISCGDHELGKMIAEVVNKAGKDGVVTLEDSQENETNYEYLEGIKIRGGYQIPIFINIPESQQAVFKNVPIVITNHKITLAEEIGRVMETVAMGGQKECVLIAESIDSDAMATAIVNWTQNRFKVLPIRVIAYGDIGEGVLRDLAAVTGANFIDQKASMKLSDITSDDLGMVDKIVSNKDESTIVAGDEETKKSVIKTLKAQLPNLKDYEAESVKERIAKLSSGMFTIKVGGVTETERKEKKLKIEDAINASKAALTDGVVAGGGSALYRSSEIDMGDLRDDERLGALIVLRACEKPIMQMAENSSMKLDKSELAEIIKNKNKTYDFRNGEIVDAHKVGIVDPLKVVISAFENAVSGSALFLTTEAAVVNADDPK